MGIFSFFSKKDEAPKEEVVKKYHSVNTWVGPSFGLLAASGVTFAIYIGKLTNAKEWHEILLDYCHHKRSQYSGHPMDKAALRVMQLLRLAPK